MRKSIYSLLCCILISYTAIAQTKFNVGIKDDKVKVKREKSEKSIYSFRVTSENSLPDDPFKDYVLKVEPNATKSTLPLGSFEIDFREVVLSKLGKEYKFYLIINPDKDEDRAREIHLDLKISSTNDPKLQNILNDNNNPGLVIKVDAVEKDTALNQYNYLAYIGTNFDLVDGIKAKNLFFATNIYKLPKSNDEAKNDVGFNLTLYGNRTLTTTDNLGPKVYDATYVKIPGKDSARVHRNQGTLVETRVSDNLGAAFSPMFNLWNLANSNRTFQLLYAPQIEFIWRRYTITRTYSDIVKLDSARVIRWRGSDIFELTPPNEVIHSNNYDVNLGLLGAFLSHETKNISLRFQAAGGYSFRYTSQRQTGLNSLTGATESSFKKQGDWFFGARLWITEAISGITLGAEVSNRIFRNYEPFYNVTLSKALSFNNIGSIFSPVTKR
jgi:hypothetical protein